MPATTITIAAGFLAYSEHLSLGLVILVALVGAILGDMLGYSVGYILHKKNKMKEVQNIDRLFKKKKYLEHGERFFKKHGGKSVLTARFLVVLRPFISFIAGMFNMNFSRFMYFNVFGASLWVLFYTSIGYFFGSSLQTLTHFFRRAGFSTAILLILILLFLYARLLYKQKIEAKVIEKSDELIDKIEGK